MMPGFRCLLGLFAASVLNIQAGEPTNSFVIPAWAFDRGNARVFTNQWADAQPMIAFGGESPVVVEYDFNLPVSAEYTLSFEYAAANSRPVQVSVDGQELWQACRAVNGSWNTSRAQWERAGSVPLAAGKHTLRLERDADFPHVTALRVESSAPFPAGWALKRATARKLTDPRPAPPFRPYEPPVDCAALRLAINDLAASHGDQYPRAAEFLQRLDRLEQALDRLQPRPADAKRTDSAELRQVKADLAALRREALLANPLLDFSQILCVRRRNNSPHLGLPANWQSNSSLPAQGYDDALCLLSLGDTNLTTLYRPGNRFLGDVDLNFDADKLLFSMLGSNGQWQVFELMFKPVPAPPMAATGRGKSRSPGKPMQASDRQHLAPPRSAVLPEPTRLSKRPLNSALSPGGGGGVKRAAASNYHDYTIRQLTGEQPDVSSYDACYLPDGRIIFTSTACFVGVPCVYGNSHVANLYLMSADGQNIRQLCFDQEHDWCPAVLNNGRVLYTRWEYTDTPHSNTRLLFHMNPDGTEQMEFLGSNSYWPNSFFYARPIPGHPTKVVSVISGHHGDARMGELVVFDPAKGRFEAEGAVQKIPGRGRKVEMVFRDQLTVGVWPKFLHPWPLSEKYFLVSCKPAARAPWGIYLVDVFDNFVPLLQLPEHALFEPIPLRPRTRPPVIPDKVDLRRKDALVYVQDIYAGDGLKGIPRGTVKSLRVFTYHFAYQEMGGLLGVIGMEGPWDIKRVLGTVPVNEDGSVKFRVPANTPLSVQPLDAEGKALQLMRSWMTAMPGETLQCAGCHEKQNHAPLLKPTLALRQPAVEITPWRGPERGFNYAREVQPVIDRYCVSCHDGSPQPNGVEIPNLRGDLRLTNWSSITPGNGGAHAGKFSLGYANLHRYVRRPGIESDYHLLTPMEFHADTTELVQLLHRGHHNVKLDDEAWDRLITWIDLNCPFHGTWSEELAQPGRQVARRRELLKRYGGVDSDPEAVPPPPAPVTPLKPAPLPAAGPAPECPGWPFDAAEAQRRQAAAGPVTKKSLELGNGVTIELVLIPAGEFVMGSATGEVDERPLSRVRMARPFWMATREIDNRTFNQFDPGHDSRVEDKNAYQFGVHGYPANRPEQPVVRVSWHEAMAFCRWLSARTGQTFTLPTEAQWEYACRAGSATPFYYGDLNTDFSKHANLADAKLSEFASDPYTVDVPLPKPTPFDDWLPKDARFNDGALLTVASGKYRPNPWGLYDLHGNAAEWTRSNYQPYPVSPNDGRDADQPGARKVVRGGSWHDVPKRSTASFRLSYPPYQRVYNVGFRIVCEEEAKAVALKAAAPAPRR